MAESKASLIVREPLFLRMLLVALPTAVLHLLVVRGALPIDVASEAAVAGVIDLVGAIIGSILARRVVTPVADPRGIAE